MVRAGLLTGGLVPDIFDEVDEDLRAEKAQGLLRRYGGVLIGAMVLTLVATGATVWWQERQRAQAEVVAARFLAAQKAVSDKSGSDKSGPGEAASVLADIARGGPDGYRVLARLQLAALEWGQGRHDSAVVAWRDVADDAAAPQLLRELATLSSVQHQVDTGDASTLKAQLQPILAGGSHWKPLAEQVTALLDLRLGRSAEALAIMKALAADPAAPQGVRQMAGDLVQSLGATQPAGVAPAGMTQGSRGAGPHG